MPSTMHINRQALFVIKGEVSLVIASLKKTARWNAHQADSKSDVLLRKLFGLKEALDGSKKSAMVKIAADASFFLEPFLEVIRSEDTSGPVTVVALTSIEKFISYEIVNEANGSTGAVESITNGVIHARFVSSDSASDELVLMKILQVLHHLFMSPLGPLLSNESVCELMQSCFRMCFIETANELLRKSAEAALTEMICLLFSRLHSFPVLESSKKQKALGSSSSVAMFASPYQTPGEIIYKDEVEPLDISSEPMPEAASPTTENAPDVQQTPISSMPEIQVQEPTPHASKENETGKPEETPEPVTLLSPAEFKTRRGVKFTVSGSENLQSPSSEDVSVYASCVSSPSASAIQTPASVSRAKITVPYGIPCVRELFRFLISLINPHDKRNTEVMIHVGLKLLLVTVETGVDSMSKHSPLLSLVRNDLCKNLISLLSYVPPQNSMLTASSILLNVMRILLLIFDSMRYYLKYQLEVFLTRMAELLSDSNGGGAGGITSPSGNGLHSSKWTYEQKEIAMDFLVQLWKLPCFVTELYLNYDCDLYSPNVFEDLTKLFSKTAFALQSGINSIHLLCLEGLVSILDGIEGHCTLRIVNSTGSMNTSASSVASDESNCSSVFYHDPIDIPSSHPTARIQAEFSQSASEVSINEEQFNAKEGRLEEGSEEKIPTDSPAQPVTPAAHSRKGYVNMGSSKIPEETHLPTHEELMAVRHKKKILHSGSEHFNTKASKGIEFLQSQGLLSTPLDSVEVARFLKENPLLDKKAIGDYVSSKKNAEILSAFVKSFDFSKTRLDEALRMFLESFRLPGEAPLISFIMEEFASHWSISNGNPFADVDAAYRLAYAVIMLNVDQHNSNVKKQGNSMKWEDFKRNLRKCNGDQDFDPDMLQEIYNAIKSEEIVMPAEHVGLVKENYLWKLLLKRGSSPSCTYVTPKLDEGVFDHDLFSIAKVPIVAALSVIFDKTTDTVFIQKCLSGFRKCATISAHYGMSDVFDNLVISLCKFTTLLSGNPDLGGSKKAQAACRAVFQHVHRHGDILREGWRNFIDCLVALFKLQILPKILMESEDFTEPSGRVSLVRRTLATVPRVEAGLFSSLYSYIALSTDSPASRSSVVDEEENRKRTQTLIIECRPELLLSESKFLQLDSLQELIKSLVYASPVPESKRKDYDEDTVVFVMEMLLKITVQNRDRALTFWDMVRDHLYEMIVAASANDMPYLLERSVVGLMRVALRLMRKEDLCPIILQSLKILLYLRPAAVVQLSQQMSFGLHEILKTTAANIHTAEEWTIIFTLLEYVGAGKVPQALATAVSQTQPTFPVQLNETGEMVSNSAVSAGEHPITLQHSLSQDPIPQIGGYGGSGVGYSSGSDRGYTSDSELEIKGATDAARNMNVSPAQSWILLSQDDQGIHGAAPQSPRRGVPINTLAQPMSTLAPPLERQLFYPDPKSLVKSCETLSFIVRDAAHITPDNFSLCVSTIRSFVESSTMKARPNRSDQNVSQMKKKRGKKSHQPNEGGSQHSLGGLPKSKSFPAPGSTPYDADESDNEDQGMASHQVSFQLLDLLHTLHLRAAQIFQWWQKENSDIAKNSTEASIWTLGWKPILQAIVILCSDSRKPVRTQALNYLQGALLVHDLQQLSATEWYSCFSQVLFPLMDKLLQPLNPQDPIGMEETRMRAVTLLSRVFLQHLSPLLQLESFPNLWLNILDFLERYLNHSEKSELLTEGIPENLKNLLLVMQTGGIFHTPDGFTRLWMITWEKIDSFLPGLRAELFRSVSVEPTRPPPGPSSSTAPQSAPPPTHNPNDPQLQQPAPEAPIAQNSNIGEAPGSPVEEPQIVPVQPLPLVVQPGIHSTEASEPKEPSAPVMESPVSTSPVPTFTIQIEENE